MNAFTIKDVENLSGIQAHTLRIWEQRYSFLKPQRTQTNIRHYNDEELRTILNVALLNRFGYRISRISKMTQDEMTEKIMQLVPIEAKHQHEINLMVQQMMDVQLDEFDQTLTLLIRNNGLKETMMNVIFPFLERIGTLWTTGRINPAQEHFVANIVRQKLLAETELLPVPTKGQTRVLLFLPEGEVHETGILFAQYLIKQKGLQNWYLGANVSLNDVAFVLKEKQPTYLYTHVTGTPQNFNLEKFLDGLQELHLDEDKKMVIAGGMTSDYRRVLPQNIQFIHCHEEIIQFVDALTT